MRHQPTPKKDSPAGIATVPWVVVDVQPLPGHRLAVRFVDGTSGHVDCSRLISSAKAGVFRSLRDPVTFAAVHVEGGAVTWPGDLDLAPDTMYNQIRAHGVWVVPA